MKILLRLHFLFWILAAPAVYGQENGNWQQVAGAHPRRQCGKGGRLLAQQG